MFYTSLKRDSALKKYAVIANGDTVNTILQRPPIYIEGEKRLLQTLISGVRYPAQARERKIQGKVIVAFTIDLEGNPTNYRIKQSVGYGLDEEAMKCIKRVNANWLPGLLNGKPVVVEYEMPVSFKLAN